jgi:hypothetical protein
MPLVKIVRLLDATRQPDWIAAPSLGAVPRLSASSQLAQPSSRRRQV